MVLLLMQCDLMSRSVHHRAVTFGLLNLIEVLI